MNMIKKQAKIIKSYQIYNEIKIKIFLTLDSSPWTISDGNFRLTVLFTSVAKSFIVSLNE